MIIGSFLIIIGAGLLITLQVDTGKAKWIGYQVLYGFGLGMGMYIPNPAVVAALDEADAPAGIDLMFFSQQLAGAIFISVGQNVFTNELASRLSMFQGFDKSMIEDSGVTVIISSIPVELRSRVLDAYNGALRNTFRVGLIIATLTVISAVIGGGVLSQGPNGASAKGEGQGKPEERNKMGPGSECLKSQRPPSATYATE
ncbi:putative MFS aflatoxin efflux [Rosellinia necatrix]|uniref:Putative MFS aflatoxin efflux n=1 Tax=Rosellinia necatrix TaxID=77044 RepID=A0A1S7UKT4_ROSNE|nr:putative MFS aflatoxin efflux [Rosellinia necatrix]